MGLFENRKIKTFTEMVVRTFRPSAPGSAKGDWTLEEDEPIDDQVNNWIRADKAVILQIHPTWTQLEDRLPDGVLVRRAILRYVVFYTTEEDFYETEARIRQMSMLGEGRPMPAAPPLPLADQEELNEFAQQGGRIVEVDPPDPNPVDPDAGGPPGLNREAPPPAPVQPPVMTDPNSFFKGAGHGRT